MLRLFKLEKFEKQPVEKLSGGEKQKLSIVLALIPDPEIIFLDELTTGLDTEARRTVWQTLLKLKKTNLTIFLTTHYMEEVEILCNHIVIIDQGQVIAEGSKEQLKNMVRENEKLIIEVPGLSQEQVEAVGAFPSIIEVIYDENYLSVTTKELKEALLPILNYFEVEKIMYANIHTQEATLNDVFLEITGKELRD